MRFSRILRSSIHSLPSPDGLYIAIILPSTLNIRATRSLETISVIDLPSELVSSISWFSWSSSSSRVLVASADYVHIYSPTNTRFKATIANPTSGTGRTAFVTFGPTDNEIYAFSDFGLKLTVFNLLTSKSVEITSPKFYTSGVAAKGFSCRPGTSNLALLTRSGGKDIISLHARENLEVTRSWLPETTDAQGLTWSPDGRWLAIWESAGQGHRIVIYTADGHLYKIWNGPSTTSEAEKDTALGAGVKLLDWSRTGVHLAVGDYSGRVTLLMAPSFMESMSLQHMMTVKPTETLQIWQEQVTPSHSGGFIREFLQTTQSTCPPTAGLSSVGDSRAKTGINVMAFDNSGTLLATRIESMPTTIWIWDVITKLLRAVLIFHAPIAKITWHPSINELLMIRCEGEECRSLVQLWDPSWEGPKIVDFETQMPGGKMIGKTIVRWLTMEASSPAIFCSDSQDCILASMSEPNDEVDLPWRDAMPRGFDIYGQREESPLNLVAADEKRRHRRVTVNNLVNDGEAWKEDELTELSGESEEIDDTFRFRKFVEP